MKIAVVVGNPKPQSRTLKIAEAVADEIAGLLDITQRAVIDLADVAGQLFEWPNDTLAALNKEVAESDILVVASPTYKATYTGLLKAFLDRYPNNGLGGVTAVPVMTGAAMNHAMAPEVNLRPLLVELGATVPTRGLYFQMSQLPELDEVVRAWRDENRAALLGAARGALLNLTVGELLGARLTDGSGVPSSPWPRPDSPGSASTRTPRGAGSDDVA